MSKDIFSKKSRFSIRKLNIGVCSVLLGTIVMMGHTVQADETTSEQSAAVSSQTTALDVSNSISEVSNINTNTPTKVSETTLATAPETSSVQPTLENQTTTSSSTETASRTIGVQSGLKDSAPISTGESTQAEVNKVISSETAHSQSPSTSETSSSFIESTSSVDASSTTHRRNRRSLPEGTSTEATSVPVIEKNLDGKASTASEVTVSAPAGTTVKLYDNNDVLIGEAVANDQGVATITPTNSLPEGDITATVTPVGGSESAKSSPVTVTKTPLTDAPGGVSNGAFNVQLLVGKSHVTVYRGDKVDVDVQAAAKAMERFWVPKNPTGVQGVLPVGGFLDTGGTSSTGYRKAKYTGTVAMTQPLGDIDVTFAVTGKKEAALISRTNPAVTITRDLKVTVLEVAKKYAPVLSSKVTVADPNNVTATEKDLIIEKVKKENLNLPTSTTYSVDEKGNVIITYPDKSTDKISAGYAVQMQPVVVTDLTDKAQTKTPVEVRTEPGSRVELFDKNGTKIGEATAGSDGIVTITPTVDIPEGNVTAKATDVKGNVSGASKPKLATLDTTAPDKPVINTNLTGKAGTQTPVEVSAEPGSTVTLYDKNGTKIGEATAGTNGKATITPTANLSEGNVTAKATDKSGNTSVASDPKAVTDTTAPDKPVINTNLTGKAGTQTPVEVSAEPGSTVTLYDKNGTKIGEATAGTNGKATITPTANLSEGNVTAKATDKSGNTSVASDPVEATKSRTDADKNDPTAKAQTVTPGSTPNAQDSIGNVSSLPNGTTYAYKTPVDTTTEGDKDAIVVVTYPDGSTDEVPVKVTVKDPRTDADKNDPTAKAQTVTPGSTPNAQDSIGNVSSLPNGTTYAYKTPVDTTTEGDKDAIVVVTYPDGSTDEVPVKVTVKDPRTDADNNTPTTTIPAPKAAPAPMMHKQTPALSAAPAAPEMSSVSTATKKQALPETGENTSLVATLFGGLMTIAGLGLAGKRKKED